MPKCQHVMTKGKRANEQCGTPTAQTTDDGLYICSSHRKNLNKYLKKAAEVKEVTYVPVKEVAEDKSNNPVNRDRTTTIQLKDPLADEVEETIDLAEAIKESMKGIIPAEDINNYRSNNETKGKRSKARKIDSFSELRRKIEDRISEVFDSLEDLGFGDGEEEYEEEKEKDSGSGVTVFEVDDFDNDENCDAYADDSEVSIEGDIEDEISKFYEQDGDKVSNHQPETEYEGESLIEYALKGLLNN